MTKPAGNVDGPDRAGQAVFAVQTASTKVTGLINFVEVTTTSYQGRTGWQVDYSSGHVRDAALDRLLAVGGVGRRAAHPGRDRAHRRPALAVGLAGRQQVFSSDSLQLDMEAPFQPYLEVQALHVPYVATFHDFWVTRDDTVEVTGLPAGADVTLDDAGGMPVARGTARSGRGGGAHSSAVRGQGQRARCTVTPSGRLRRLHLGRSATPAATSCASPAQRSP